MSSVLIGGAKKSDAQFARLKKRIEGVASGFEKIGKGSLIAGGALLAASGLNLQAAKNFEKGMTNVSTLIDTTKESISSMSTDILNMSRRVPVAIDGLTSSLYNIRSAGIDAADAMSVLEKSARLGVAGLGSTDEAVDLVTSSINAFNIKGKEQARLYDTIFKTVKYGKTNISQIAQGFGSVAGTISAANIKLDDYLAAVAAMTTSGLPAARAHMQIKTAVAGLTRNTKEQAQVFQQLGARDFNDLIKRSGSMVNAFAGINRAVNGSKERLISLLGSVQAYNAVLSLTGANNGVYVQALDDMRRGTNAVDAAFAKQTKTLDSQLRLFGNAFESLRITMGEDLVPAFGKIVSATTVLIDKFANMPAPLRKLISVSSAVTGVGLAGFGTLSLAIAGSLKMIVSFGENYRRVAGFMQVHRFTAEVKSIQALTAGFRVLGIAIAGTPVGWLIAGLAGIAAGVIIIRKYWTPLAQFFKGLADGIKSSLIPAFNGIKTALSPLSPIFNAIGRAVSAVWGALVKLIAPVNTAGQASYNLGKSIGEVIGGVIRCAGAIFAIFTPIGRLIGMTLVLGKNFERIKKAVAGASAGVRNFFGNSGENKNVSGKINGSHAGGLSSVPFDGYIAELHKGERVLTAQENRNLTRRQSTPAAITVNFSPTIHADGNTDILAIKRIIEEQCSSLIARLNEQNRRRLAGAYVCQ